MDAPLDGSESPVTGYTTEGVLSFLCDQFQKHEQAQSGWKREKSALRRDLRALEAVVRGYDAMKHDLLRRIDMLEAVLDVRAGGGIGLRVSPPR